MIQFQFQFISLPPKVHTFGISCIYIGRFRGEEAQMKPTVFMIFGFPRDNYRLKILQWCIGIVWVWYMNNNNNNSNDSNNKNDNK